MDRPALPDMSNIVSAAMTMRDATNNVLFINDQLAGNPVVTPAQRMQQAKDMRKVVEMQQTMIERLLESYMNLADMTDQFYNKLDATITKIEKEH
jgi:dynactin complex subunit